MPGGCGDGVGGEGGGPGGFGEGGGGGWDGFILQKRALVMQVHAANLAASGKTRRIRLSRMKGSPA
jgi:hypothetical protein